MSWLFSQALVEEYSEERFSDGKRYAPLNITPTPQAFYSHGKTMDFSRPSRFGMTFEPLMENHGEDILMWFRVVSRARTYPQPEEARESLESDPGYGLNSLASLARYDPGTHSLRTAQCSLFEDSTECCAILPRWGLMRNGECLEQTPLVRHTSETGYGLWQTPVADYACNREAGKWNSRGEPKLSAQVKLLPTPRAFMHKDSATDRGKGNLGEVVGGQLNPTWVEWLMGWPLGWTDLQPLATDKYRNVQQWHGVF